MRLATGRRGLAAFGLLLIALAAIIHLQYRADIAQARERVHSGSRIAQTECGPIEYATAGSGPPVLVVHGAGGGFDQGLAAARLLIQSGFHVIAPSRFGYLRTPLPESLASLAETQAEAHACLLDTLGISRVAVFGGSAGAPSSMRLCLKYPERCLALVLFVPAAYAPKEAGGQVEPPALTKLVIETTLRSDFLFWAITSVVPDMMIRTMLATPPSDVKNATPEEQARVREVLWHVLPVSERADGLQHEAASISGAPGPEELKEIRTPTLLFSIENDLFGTYASAQYAAKHMPNARFIGYPTGGHVWVGHETDIWREVSAFIRQHQAATRSESTRTPVFQQFGRSFAGPKSPKDQPRRAGQPADRFRIPAARRAGAEVGNLAGSVLNS